MYIWGTFPKIMSVPQNIVMDLNNVQCPPPVVDFMLNYLNMHGWHKPRKKGWTPKNASRPTSKVSMPNSVTPLTRTTYVWVVCGKVWMQERTPKRHLLKIYWMTCVNMIKGGPIWPLNEHEHLHFANEQDIHMSSQSIEGKWLTTLIWVC